MNQLSQRIRDLRTEKRLSAKALGNLIDLSDATIIDWENGKHDIKSEYLIRLANLFGVTTDYLLSLSDD